MLELGKTDIRYKLMPCGIAKICLFIEGRWGNIFTTLMSCCEPKTDSKGAARSRGSRDTAASPRNNASDIQWLSEKKQLELTIREGATDQNQNSIEQLANPHFRDSSAMIVGFCEQHVNVQPHFPAKIRRMRLNFSCFCSQHQCKAPWRLKGLSKQNTGFAWCKWTPMR